VAGSSGSDPDRAQRCSKPVSLRELTRIFDEQRLTYAVFWHVAKTFDTVWGDRLPYKLAALIS
jgi:hypothetical protein